ncbi:nucleopolyhedrovirus P10 family protein [Streptomyces sp. NPDC088387]|uniref:nucleopolyhedrovirus P10 family protein n=1 Tax=Streptomyces sp. NPDC088387 TaxID=3365859 RepID=UPI00382F58A3
MTADQWTREVRHRLGLGRLLPLGGARDGVWIAEAAAATVLRRAADAVPGVRLGALRIAPAEAAPTHEAAVPAPPSALPPGPLRVTADFSATAAEPLPATASRLRDALAEAATRRLGLTVDEVDLRVTGLLEADATAGPEPTSTRPGRAPASREHTLAHSEQEPVSGGVPPSTASATDEERVAGAVLGVPGVSRLTGALDGLGRAVHIEDGAGDGTAVPRRHVRVEIAVDADHRTLDVARAVRTKVGRLSGRPSVAVLVTAVGPS